MTKTALMLAASLVIGIFSLGAVRYAVDHPGRGHNIGAFILLIFALALAALS